MSGSSFVRDHEHAATKGSKAIAAILNASCMTRLRKVLLLHSEITAPAAGFQASLNRACVNKHANRSDGGVSVCRAGRIIAKTIIQITYAKKFLPELPELMRGELPTTRSDPEKVPWVKALVTA